MKNEIKTKMSYFTTGGDVAWMNIPKWIMKQANIKEKSGYGIKKVNKNTFDIIKMPISNPRYETHVDGRGKIPISNFVSIDVSPNSSCTKDFKVKKVDKNTVRITLTN